jgi:hypothetical protein
MRVHVGDRAEELCPGRLAGQGRRARRRGRGQALRRPAGPPGPAPPAAMSAIEQNWSNRFARPAPRPRPGSGGRARTGWRAGRVGRRLRRLGGRGPTCCFARSMFFCRSHSRAVAGAAACAETSSLTIPPAGRIQHPSVALDLLAPLPGRRIAKDNPRVPLVFVTHADDGVALFVVRDVGAFGGVRPVCRRQARRRGGRGSMVLKPPDNRRQRPRQSTR